MAERASKPWRREPSQSVSTGSFCKWGVVTGQHSLTRRRKIQNSDLGLRHPEQRPAAALADARAARERDLELTIDTIPVLAWTARPDGTAEYGNARYLDYVGLSLEEMQGWGWTAAVHPADLTGLADAWQAILAAGRAGEGEARLRRHDGEYRTLLFRVNPLRDATGNIVRWYGVNTDIEDHRRVEEDLRRSEAFLAKGQELSLTGTFSWDPLTARYIWSEQLYRIFAF